MVFVRKLVEMYHESLKREGRKIIKKNIKNPKFQYSELKMILEKEFSAKEETFENIFNYKNKLLENRKIEDIEDLTEGYMSNNDCYKIILIPKKDGDEYGIIIFKIIDNFIVNHFELFNFAMPNSLSGIMMIYEESSR